MPDFHEIRFPDDLSERTTGGPTYGTSVIVSAYGKEQRIGQWGMGRLRYNINYDLRRPDVMKTLITFFRARKGRLYGFRFKDPSDYSVTDQLLVTPTGSPHQMQLRKVYDSGGFTETRLIYKPVTGQVSLKKNGVAWASSGNWTIDYTTGIITITGSYLVTDTFHWTGQFDVPVRFDTDNMQIEFESTSVYSWRSIPIVEIIP